MRRSSLRNRVWILLLWALLGMLAAAQSPSGASSQAPPQPAGSMPVNQPSSKAEQPKTTPPEKVVLRVGDQEITAGELYRVIGVTAEQALQVGSKTRRSLGDQYTLMLLLANQAVRDGLDSTPDFTQQLAWLRNQQLAQMEYKKLTDGIKVTPEDISQYYASHKSEFEQGELRRVYVHKKAPGAKSDAPGLPPQEARGRAEAISKEWAAGRDLKEIEKEIGDPKVAYFDQATELAFLKQLPAEIQNMLVKLNPGEVSEPIDTPQVYLVLQLVRRVFPDARDVSEQIKDKLQKERTDAALAELKRKTNIWIDEEYFNYNPSPPHPSTAKPRSIGDVPLDQKH
ncbi:MAG TPA: peptidyl-prolyl cis-trans isomerase [Terriglobales bacterium]|nr:peptidyl-prolyl cis-trans isomerase [Terriglobales bacterium]